MKYKNIFPYLIALILLSWIIYVISKDEHSIALLKEVHFLNFGVSLLFSCVIFYISGWQLQYLIKRSTGISLKNEDLLLLPASMNLWSYLLPFRGGLIYSMFYIKSKYQVTLVQGFSIGLFTFLLSTSIAGLFGIYLSVTNIDSPKSFLLVSTILFISPLILYLTKSISKKLLSVNLGPLRKVNRMYFDTITNIQDHLKDVKSTLIILTSISVSIVVYMFWVYWSVISLGIDMSPDSIIILALVLRLSVIARFIPGNLGVQELISGVASELMGGSLIEGILIALFIRITALCIAIILGIYGFLTNIDHLKSFSFIELWKKFKNY